MSWPPPPTAHDIGAARVTFLDVISRQLAQFGRF